MYLFCGFEGPNFEILSTFMQIWGLIGQRAADNTDVLNMNINVHAILVNGFV